MNTINEFKGKYFFLSNFYNREVTYNGFTFKNNEAAFQSMKCPERIAEFINLNPSEAKRLGRRVKLRTDWEDIKDNIMYEICMAKFTQNQDLQKRLLETGNAYLIEGNTWGDIYWGMSNNFGENKLGIILMKIRTYFQRNNIL